MPLIVNFKNECKIDGEKVEYFLCRRHWRQTTRSSINGSKFTDNTIVDGTALRGDDCNKIEEPLIKLIIICRVMFILPVVCYIFNHTM